MWWTKVSLQHLHCLHYKPQPWCYTVIAHLLLMCIEFQDLIAYTSHFLKKITLFNSRLCVNNCPGHKTKSERNDIQ